MFDSSVLGPTVKGRVIEIDGRVWSVLNPSVQPLPEGFDSCQPVRVNDGRFDNFTDLRVAPTVSESGTLDLELERYHHNPNSASTQKDNENGAALQGAA